ncbi:cell division protein FtsA [Candidatus Collierbacteria bacterium RIFCSPLOWO2_01_FULL_50_23]|uniref:Cell division protein FtsA n=2 Tax=Candidatus Collieribacteriota TaxID=1752725 RepID=A0A1F5EXM5_9BACT|nr:MAG: cell division protein FtsA [Candidatus Collierbacteria bacterium RIFCSPHIGHO2_01_FULL_50_25]OGD72163.1 MAG: cell division protein FtsA [Candidatus Collierbacteria bacterium RIFCSPHIGHO2_02_FULL_49_10]OGD74641.1 MAG: cell division protein FtsA [Candidatus Collierbacteria bacterium RIFCSPLOWO2_01_FULL_50_23]
MARQTSLNAIDIGSSKISCLISIPSQDSEKINVVGVATTPSRGVRKGLIVDIEEAVGAITDCVEAAERMAGFSINSAYVSISGDHIQSQNSKGVVAITQPEGEIDQEDVYRVVEAARAISLPSSREILHVLAREYIVDSQRGIKDPIGMAGVRLETDAHLITSSAIAMKNLARCVTDIGIDVSGMVYTGLASAHSVLTETEKELGVVLVDIGGGTTSLSVFVEGACCYSAVIPVGAKKVTDDLAIGLMVSLESSEKIKHFLSKQPEVTVEKTTVDEISLTKLGLKEETKSVSRKTVVDGIIRPRLNEIFTLVGTALKKSGYAGQTPAGIVLCGGGAMTVDAASACKRVLQLPTRLGTPAGLSGLIEEIDSPAYAVIVGLVLYGAGKQHEYVSVKKSGFDQFTKRLPLKGMFGKFVEFIKSFLP